VRESGKVLLYKCGISPGEHTVSFVFVLRSPECQKKVEGEIAIEIRERVNLALLRSREDPLANPLTTLLYQ
jgi:hypothetical protein